MRLLVSKKPETLVKRVGRERYDRYLGCLMCPPRSRYVTDMDVVWGMDNNRFVCLDFETGVWDASKWNADEFINLMEAKRHIPGCRFVVAPDVLLNAAATIAEFFAWRTIIRDYGYPVALAIQDGVQLSDIPWGMVDAIFIGGSNALKFSLEVRIIVRIAKSLGLWVHWGRGSTPNFLHYAKAIGCDSADSSALARFVDDRLMPVLPVLYHEQRVLFPEWVAER